MPNSNLLTHNHGTPDRDLQTSTLRPLVHWPEVCPKNPVLAVLALLVMVVITICGSIATAATAATATTTANSDDWRSRARVVKVEQTTTYADGLTRSALLYPVVAKEPTDAAPQQRSHLAAPVTTPHSSQSALAANAATPQAPLALDVGSESALTASTSAVAGAGATVSGSRAAAFAANAQASARTAAAMAGNSAGNAGSQAPMHLQQVNLLAAPHLQNDTLTAGAKERVQSLLGHDITAELLQRVLNELTYYYRVQEGYTGAQAFLPAQAIEQGKVDFVVASADLNAVNVENKSSVDDDYLDYLLSAVKALEGEPIQEDELNSRLLRLTDLGVFNISGEFGAVDPNGLHHDLDLQVRENGHRVGFALFADNQGNETSGRYRFGGQLKVRNILGFADTLSLFYARTNEQQNNYSLNYELPLNSHPTVVGVDFCYSDYELGSWYRDLGAQGNSYSLEGYVKEPIYRDPLTAVNFRAGVRYRDLVDEFSAFDLKFQKHSISGYAEINGYQRLGAQQQHTFAFTQRFTVGHLGIDDDWGVYEPSDYVISNSNLSFSSRLTPHLTYLGELDVQLASNSLDGSEQFLAGGQYGLSAYEASDLAGDAGAVLSHSLMIQPWIKHSFTITPHVDMAHVDNKDFEGDSGMSAGLSLDYYNSGLLLHLDYSHGLGAMPEYAEDAGRLNFTVSYRFD